MYTDRQELADTYRGYSDEEIASLHAQVESLTLEARDALALEIERRGLKSAQLTNLYAAEQRREAHLDSIEKTRRKKLAIYLLLGRDPKLTLVMLGVAAVLIVLAVLLRPHH